LNQAEDVLHDADISAGTIQDVQGYRIATLALEFQNLRGCAGEKLIIQNSVNVDST
jgi:hypothetical protein